MANPYKPSDMPDKQFDPTKKVKVINNGECAQDDPRFGLTDAQVEAKYRRAMKPIKYKDKDVTPRRLP